VIGARRFAATANALAVALVTLPSSRLSRALEPDADVVPPRSSAARPCAGRAGPLASQ